jgi:hypothetical protein
LNDPLVIERLVRRELNYRPQDEAVVRWSSHALQSVRIRPVSNAASELSDAFDGAPQWLAAVRPWLPNWPWRKLFAEPPNRGILMLMSGGLLVSAFMLYGAPRPARRVA